jgi:hypothetical protein
MNYDLQQINQFQIAYMILHNKSSIKQYRILH